MLRWANSPTAPFRVEGRNQGSFLLVFPLLILDAGVLRALLPVAAKWLLIGRFRVEEIPLWSPRYLRFWTVKLLLTRNPGLGAGFTSDGLSRPVSSSCAM